MKQLALALVTVVAVVVASDVAFARGGAGGYHGGGRGSVGNARYHVDGANNSRGRAGGHGAGSQGGSYSNRWHGGWHGGGWHGGWYGPRLGVYLSEPAYANVWPYAYYATYPGYHYPYPVYTSDTTTVYAQSEQQVAPQYYWYYCADPAGYYPYIQNCNDEWLPVIPQR